MIKEITMASIKPTSYASPVNIYECPNGSTATMLYFRVNSLSVSNATISLHKIPRTMGNDTVALSQANSLIYNETVPANGFLEKRVFFPIAEGERFFFTSNDTGVSVVATGINRSR